MGHHRLSPFPCLPWGNRELPHLERCEQKDCRGRYLSRQDGLSHGQLEIDTGTEYQATANFLERLERLFLLL